MRQVTHALLTRPPLGILKSIRKLQSKYLVRLACVRHAASVHPEPGSNSQIKCLRCQIEVQNHWFFSCLYCLFRFWTFVLFHGLSCRHHSQENPNEIWINVQGCFVIQLSRFRFHAKAFIFYHIDFCLSRTFLTFLKKFFLHKLKRRRRDLNPRAGFPTYTLSRGASSASWVLLQSKVCYTYSKKWRREWDSNPRYVAVRQFSRLLP